MSIIYDTFYNFLTMLIPDGFIADFGDMNKIIAYMLTLGLVWFFIVRPIINLFKRG